MRILTDFRLFTLIQASKRHLGLLQASHCCFSNAFENRALQKESNRGGGEEKIGEEGRREGEGGKAEGGREPKGRGGEGSGCVRAQVIYKSLLFF